MSELQPTHSWRLSEYVYSKNHNLQGNYLLNLKTPTRFPDVSRKYIQGDPVRHIDWKAFVRCDQLIVREQNVETSGVVSIGCDIGHSFHLFY